MDVFRIQGGARLVGEVHITGAKNSSLKLMAVALLAPGKTTIRAVPNILDVTIMAELLRRLGCSVSYSAETETVEIDVPATIEHRADYDLVRRMRASIAVLGPLVARTGAADVALPGGDAIGSRGLDMHTAGLERMGATVTNEHGYLVVHAPDGGLVGTHVYLDFPSVGATETLLMAAVTANGVTVVDNAAREPEIVDICNMLLAMGAQIDGVGTSLLTITGVSSLKAVEHTTVDQIPEGGKQDGRDDDDDDLLHGDGDIAEMQNVADQRRDRLVARTLRDLDEVRQNDRHADRGDQRRQARRVAQRPVGDALQPPAERHADQYR